MFEADGFFARSRNLSRFVDDGRHGTTHVDGTDDEAKLIAGAERLVGGKRSALSAACTAQTRYLGIEVQVSAARFGQLVRVSSQCEFLLAPRQRRG